MRKLFNVNVNGHPYVVEVEEVGGENTAPASQPAPVVAQEKKAEPVVQPAAKPVASASGKPLKGPMPGKILKLLCKSGDQVKCNQKVLVLEAMKMENDIVAPYDGVIEFLVKEGDDVSSQQELAVIK